MARSGEIRSLTGLRGVAACLVMLYHLGGHQIGFGAGKTFIEHGYLWVDLFLCLSGFVLALTYTRLFVDHVAELAYRRFILDRIARIFPLLWFVTLVAFARLAFGLHAGGGAHDVALAPAETSLWWTFATNMALIQAWGIGDSLIGPAWSLSTEWAVSLAFPLLVILVMRGSMSRAGVATCLAVAALAWLALLPADVTGAVRVRGPLDMATGSNYAPLLRCTADFVLGMAAFRLSGHPGLRGAASRNWFSGATTVAIVVLLMVPGADLWIVLLFPVLVVSVSVGSPVAARLLGAPPIRFLGTISYSIYLTHTLVALAQPHLLRALVALHVPAAFAIALLAIAGVSIAVSVVTHRVIEVGVRAQLRHWLAPLWRPEPLATSLAAP